MSWVQNHGDVTNSEIAQGLDLPINVVSARVNAELGPGGRLYRSGARACRVTSHQAATVAYRGTD